MNVSRKRAGVRMDWSGLLGGLAHPCPTVASRRQTEDGVRDWFFPVDRLTWERQWQFSWVRQSADLPHEVLLPSMPFERRCQIA